MNTLELEKFARNDKFISRHFRGVFPSDKLPNDFKDNECLICNICPSQINGIASYFMCHWVCLLLDTRKINYYCSSGKQSFLLSQPLKEFLEKFLVRGYKLEYNSQPIQSEKSSMCGQFVISFLAIKYRTNISIKQFNKIFYKKQLIKNDKIIEKVFNELFLKKSF